MHENFKNDNMKSNIFIHINLNSFVIRDCRGGDRMVDGFTTNCIISDYSRELEPRTWGGVLDTTLCDQVCQ